jgi:hypothetical protein
MRSLCRSHIVVLRPHLSDRTVTSDRVHPNQVRTMGSQTVDTLWKRRGSHVLTTHSSSIRFPFFKMQSTMFMVMVIAVLYLPQRAVAQDDLFGAFADYTMDDSSTLMSMFDAAKFRRHRRVRAILDTNITCKTVGCGDHGTCVDNVGCVCDQDSTKGYWQRSNEDGRCTKCMTGFAGSNCVLECQGGSCNICSGNGDCSQDVTGDGTCTCYRNKTNGFWSGSSCSSCASGYFGSKCKNYCPGVDSGTPCGGRGECKTDANGNGACVCDNGYEADSGCIVCDRSHYSVSCSLTCPGYVTSGADLGKPCSGHGKCFNGTDGNGTCVCDRYWGLEDCSKQCLNACSGHGECSDGSTGTGQCSCDVRYAPPDCGSCIANRTGVECEIDCPVNGDLEVCNNHGACNYTMKISVYAHSNKTANITKTQRSITAAVVSATRTATATYRSFCTCAPGYTGSECEVGCAGDPPCNGHGVCKTTAGLSRCECFQSNETGFWSGDTCATCSPSHNNSVNCNVLCPVSDGVICSGHGYCAEGYCYCQRRDPASGYDYCGSACEESSLPPTSDTGQCSKCGCFLCSAVPVPVPKMVLHAMVTGCVVRGRLPTGLVSATMGTQGWTVRRAVHTVFSTVCDVLALSAAFAFVTTQRRPLVFQNVLVATGSLEQLVNLRALSSMASRVLATGCAILSPRHVHASQSTLGMRATSPVAVILKTGCAMQTSANTIPQAQFVTYAIVTETSRAFAIYVNLEPKG